MQPVREIVARAVPLDRSDVDTDQIIPKQFLKRIERSGFGPFLFYDWRRGADGQLDPAFVINRPEYASASILVSGPNFGCGSSREHAAWALQDAGFRIVIAPSFADIFRANAIGNGMLPVTLPEASVNELLDRAEAADGYTIEIDLERCEVADDRGFVERFSMDEASRQRLLGGLDEIDMILAHETDIAAFERKTPLVSKAPPERRAPI
jgi:3-isopropylmalate/(R)-2-methylmalate dehydratase small subunit